MRILFATLTFITAAILESFGKLDFGSYVQAGVVRPEKPNSVLPYRNNEKALGKYSFYFKISSPVNSNPLITIDFPPTYPALMADIEKCKGKVEVLLRSEIRWIDCLVFGNQVVFNLANDWPELDAGNIIIDLFGIINPVGTISTGNFAIRTWSGQDIVIDNNLVFQGIGFSPYYGAFTSVTMDNDGSDIAGYTTNYVLGFQNTVTLKVGSWFRMEFPDGFGFGKNMDCYIENLAENLANLPCYAQNQTLFMKDLKYELVAGSIHKIKMRNIRNPYIATPDTGTFVFETMKEGVNTVYEYEGFVPGIAISPGQITETVVVGFPLVQNLFVDYSIKFKPMNSIPEGGLIEIQFPPTYQGLDTSCRIVSGLEKLPDKEISCTTAGDLLIIKNFKEFSPKFIEVKSFAYNPPTAGETPHWQIRTYKDELKTQKIDENPTAGTVPISSIDRPNFFGIDLYKKIVNCSWLERCPIDFRFFPNPGNNLTRHRNSGEYGNLALQIPIWWQLYSNNSIPECKFGDEATAGCEQEQHIFSIRTPILQDYEYCELPVSVKYARMTPIPGKYPWRILSFQDGEKWYKSSNNWWDVPKEQDTYMMDIPIVSMSVLQTYASGSEAGDPDNVLHIRSNIHPFLFSYQGTIFVNVSHTYNSLDDSSAWPLKVGFTAADNSAKAFPCKVYVYGRETGYLSSWDYYPDVRCYIRTGDSITKNNTVIQIVGFDRNIEKGNYFEFIFPRFSFCTTIGRQCKITVGYTMTHNLEFPYITNRKEKTLGTVGVDQNQWAANLPMSKRTPHRTSQKCSGTDFYLYVQLPVVLKIGDYVIIRRILSHWHFTKARFYTFRYNSGTQQNMFPVLDYENDWEYWILKLTENIGPATSNNDGYRFRIRYLTNTPYANNAAHIHFVAYSNRIKVVKGDMTSYLSTAGGIHSVASYSNDELDGRHSGADRRGTGIGYIQGYHAVRKIRFKNCMEVPHAGEMRIQFISPDDPSAAYAVQPQWCRVWRMVVNQKANETHVRCVWDEAKKAFRMTEFLTVMKLTYPIYMHWRADIPVGTTNFGQLRYQIHTFNDTTNDATKTDWTTGTYTIGGGGAPSVFAPHSMWYKFKKHEYDMYKNLVGSFVFDIETGDDMIYTPGEADYFEFRFDDSIELVNTLECRYAVYDPPGSRFPQHHYPSVSCTMPGPGHVRMKMHPYLEITGTKRYQIIIDSRHLEMTEGWRFTEPGVYTLGITTFLGATATKSKKQRFEVFGERIPHFFIYSANKIAGEESIFMIWAEFFSSQRFTTSMPTSDTQTYWKLAVYFGTEQKVGGVLDGKGFKQDLGTGWDDQSLIPCKVHYMAFGPNVQQMNCTLFYGYNGAPARVEIVGFVAKNSRFVRVDLPGIFNPVQIHMVPKVWFKILETRVVSGNKLTSTRFEGHYHELNTTCARYIPWFAYTGVDNEGILTMSTNDLDTTGTLTIPFTAPVELSSNDWIMIKFPPIWPVPYGMNYVDCKNMAVKDQNCYSIRNTRQDFHIVYSKITGYGTLDRVIQLKLKSPLAVISPTAPKVLETYVFHHTRLIAKYDHTKHNFGFTPDPIDITVSCFPATPIQHTETEYTISFTLPHDLIKRSEIKIDFDQYLPGLTPGCKTTSSSGGPSSFSCDKGTITVGLDVNKFASMYEFNEDIPKDTDFEIVVPILNPVALDGGVLIDRAWRVRTYYIKDPARSFLLGDSDVGSSQTHIPSCQLQETAIVTRIYWPAMYHETDRTRCTETGPIVFHYKSNFLLDMTADNDYIEVYIPLVFTPTIGELVAQWGFEFARWWDYVETATHHKMTIRSPKTYDVVDGQLYLLNLTTLNGVEDKNGWTYPPDQGTHYAEIKTFKGGVQVEEGVAKIFVFEKQFTALFEASSYLMNSGYRASFNVKIKSSGLSSGGKYIFKLPTATYLHKQRVLLFDSDGGTGLQNGDSLSCHARVDNNYYAPSCKFYKGSQENGIPARVEMTGVPSISSSKVLWLTFDGFNHPVIGGDNLNVEASVEYHRGSNHYYTGVAYDYTIVNDNSYDALTDYEGPVFSTNVVGSVNANLDVKFKCPIDLEMYQAGSGVGWANYIIIEFPVGFVVRVNTQTTAKLMSGPGKGSSGWKMVEFSSGNNWIIWRPDINKLKINSEYTLRLKNVDQAKSLPNDSTFRVYIVRERQMLRKIVYKQLTSLQPPAILPAEITLEPVEMAAGTIPKNKYQLWKLNFAHSNAYLNEGGIIQIKVPSSFTPVDKHCFNGDTSDLKNTLGNDIFCEWNAVDEAYYITNYQNSVASEVIVLYFYATTEDASPGAGDSLIIKAFQDKEMNFLLLEGSVAVPNIRDTPGFLNLKFDDRGEAIPDVIRAGDTAPFEIEMTIPTSWGATPYTDLTFPTGVSIPANGHLVCMFGNYEASRCEATSTSPLTIRIHTPHDPVLTAGEKYKIILTTTCGSNNVRGLTFANSGELLITTSSGGFTDFIRYKIYTEGFLAASFRTMFSNKNVKNAFAIRVQLQDNIPTGGKLRFKLPRVGRGGQHIIWESAGTPSGEYLENKCRSVSSNLAPTKTVLTCRYYEDETSNVWELSDFSALATSTDIEFVIYGITNPDITGDLYQVDGIVQSVDDSGDPINESVLFDMFGVLDVSTSTTTNSNTVTRSGDNLLQTGVSYNFKNVVISTTLKTDDQVVFEFNSAFFFPFSLSKCSGTANGNYKSYGQYVVFKPNVDISGTIEFCFKSARNPYGNYKQRINIYPVYSRGYTKKITYKMKAHTEGALAITLTPSILEVNGASKYSFELDTLSKIPSYGIVKFTFPAGYTYLGAATREGIRSGATFSTDTSGAELIVILKTRQLYDRAVDALAKIDIYVNNPGTAGDFDIEVEAHATEEVTSRMFKETTTVTLIGTDPQDSSCAYAAAPFQAAAGSAATLDISTAGANLTPSFTAPTLPGYDMITGVNSAGAACQGIPFYGRPTNSFNSGPAIELGHLSTHEANKLNYVKFTGKLRGSDKIEAGVTVFSIDFGNHDADDLGTGLSNGEFIPCEFLAAGVVNPVVCTLRIGTQLIAPGVEIRFKSEVSGGTVIQIVIGHFSNPSTARTIEVRVRQSKNTMGSLMVDSVSYSDTFDILASTPATANAGTVDFSGTQAQAITATADFNLLGSSNGQKIIVFGPNKLLRSLDALPSTGGFDEAYPNAGVYVQDILAGGTISGTDFANSVAETSTDPYFAVEVNSGTSEVLSSYTVTPSAAIQPCSLIGVAFNALTKNDVDSIAKYDFRWTTACALPQGSSLEITLPAYTSNVVVGSYQLISGTIKGAFSFRVSGSKLIMENYDYVSPGTYRIQMILKASIGGGSNTAELKASVSGKTIFENTSINLAQLTADNKAAFLNYRDYLPFKKPTYKAEFGYLSLIFQPRTTFDASDVLTLTPPATFGTTFFYYTRCKFTDMADEERLQYLSKYCRWDITKKYFEVMAPENYVLDSSKIYKLELFHIGELNPGIFYPSNPIIYDFTITLSNSGGDIKEEFVTKFIVAEKTPKETCFKNFLSNSGKKNVFMMRFKPATNILRHPSTTTSSSVGFLEFEFPAGVIIAGVKKDAFAPDLGRSGYHKEDIKCLGYTYSGGTKTLLATITGCRIHFGAAGEIHRNPIVEVINSATLTTSNTYVIDIYGIKNPAADQILSHVVMYSGQFLAGLKAYTNIQYEKFHIYTSNPTPTTEAAQNLPTISPVTIQTPTDFNLAVNTASSVSLEVDFDHIRLEYNDDMHNPDVDASNFKPFDVDPGLAYFYSKTTKTTNFNLQLTDMSTPTSAVPAFASSFKVQVIKNKVIMNEISYNVNGNSFSSVDFTSVGYVPTTDKARASDTNTHVVSLQFSKRVKAGGCLYLTMNNMAQAFDKCTELTTYLGNDYKCETVSPTKLRVSNFKEIPVGATVQISVSATASAATNGEICVSAYEDTPALIATPATDLVQNENCASLVYSAYPAIKWFEARTPMKQWRIQAEERGTITMKFDTGGNTLTQNTDYIKIENPDGEFGEITTRDFRCFFDYFVAKSCIYVVADNAWTIFIPRETDLSGTYILTVTAYRQRISKDRVNGILFPLEEHYSLELAGFDASDAEVFRDPHNYVYVPPWKFLKMYFNTFLIQTSSYAHLRATFKTNEKIEATPLGQIIIELKNKNRYGHDVFLADLNTAKVNGQDFECVSSADIKCRLFLGTANTPTQIIVDPQVAIAKNANIEIHFPQVFNPAIDFTEVKVLITARNYDKINKIWNRLSQHLNDIYVTRFRTYPTSNLPAPALADTKVGANNAITWTFTMQTPDGPADPRSLAVDKFVVKVNKEVLEHITNRKPTTPPPTLNCPGFTYNIYYDTDCIEFTPTSTIAPGTTVNIACTNFFTPQYVIRGGMRFILEVWLDGLLSEVITYGNILWQTNDLVNADLKYSSEPSPAETDTFDTYTFKFKPTNYVRKYGKIEIFFDKKFSGLTNCELKAGLNGGVCEIQEDKADGFDYIILKDFKLYHPDTDPDIEFTIDMVSPGDAGTYDFNFKSTWLINDANPLLEDLIDEGLIQSIPYTGLAQIPYVKLDPIKIYVREACWHTRDHGTFQFEIDFSADTRWEDEEYIVLYPFQFGRYTGDYSRNPYISEFICWFDHDEVLHSMKSEKCYMESNYLYIWLPEEKSLYPGNRMMVNVEWRGQRDRGLSTGIFPKMRHIMVYSNSTKPGPATEVGVLEWQQRACYWGNRDYVNTNWHQHHNNSLDVLDHAWISYNSGADWNGRDFRFQVQYSTNNEMKDTSHLNLGYDDLTVTNQTKRIPCMYTHNHNTLPWPQLVWSYDEICEVYRTADHGLDNTAVITFNNITNKVYSDVDMRWGIPGMRNYFVADLETPNHGNRSEFGTRNTFTHITISSQVMLDDGVWWDTHRSVKWRHLATIRAELVDASITEATTPTINDLRYGLIHVTMILTIPSVPANYGFGFKYYQIEDPWWYHPRNKTHSNRYCRDKGGNNLRCLMFDKPWRWAIFRINSNTGNNMQLRHFGMMESPTFAIQKPFWVYFANGNWLRYIMTGLHRSTAITPHLILEMELRDNPINTKVYYRVGMLTFNYNPWTKYVKMWIPQAFPTIGPHCRVNFGYRKEDIDDFDRKTKCRIGTENIGPTPYHLAEFYHIYHYSRRWWDQYDALFIFDIDLENPTTPQWTPTWQVIAYDNYHSTTPNLTRLHITSYPNDSPLNVNPRPRPRTWVGEIVPVANYFRVYRNRHNFEERRQKQGEWAELHMRIYPKNIIPMDIGKVEIQLPTDYDVPNGGVKICEVGHFNHIDLEGQFCEISNERKVTVRTHKDHGLNSVCTIVRITTEGAVGYLDGFQAPPVASTGNFNVYLWDNTQLLEFMGDDNAPDAIILEAGADLNITTTCNEILQKSIVMVSFNARVQLRAGYDSDPLQTDVFKKKPQGRLKIIFNNRDKYAYGRAGFKSDLGIGPAVYGTPIPIKCVPFKNLKPKKGGELECELWASFSDNYYTPTVVIVKNFEMLAKDTETVELHILNLDWTRDRNNYGWIEFSAFEVEGDGTNSTLYDVTRIQLESQNIAGVGVQARTAAADLPVFQPNFVGSQLSLFFPISIPGYIYQGDAFEFTFPDMFEFPPNDSDISAIFRVSKHPYDADSIYSFPAEVRIYRIIQEVHFFLPKSYNIYGCTTSKKCKLKIVTSGFRHASYAAPSPFNIDLRIISKLKTYMKYQYQGIVPPVIAKFNSLLVTMSSQFSEDVYVTYDFFFTPSYHYPADTKINIELEWTKYRHIDKSYPLAKCHTNFGDILKYCVIKEARIEVELKGKMPEGFAAQITLTGIKNPKYIGQTGINDIRLEAVHPSTYLINEGYMNILNYKSKRNVDTMFFKIALTSYYERVTADYEFILQNTNRLPSFGTINIELPEKWATVLPDNIKISQLLGTFSRTKLIYSEKFIKEPSGNILLQIIPEFEWPAKQPLKIKLSQIINPDDLPITEPFFCYTKYDSELIDKSDIKDPGATIKFINYEPKITMWKTDFSPKNEVEHSVYTFKLSSADKLMKGECIQFLFPTNYDDLLLDYTKKLECTSPTIDIDICTHEKRVAKICLNQDIPEDELFEIVLNGVVNPNYKTFGYIDISTSDPNGKILQFTKDVALFQTLQAPDPTPLTKIETTSTDILVKADYNFCMDVPGPIPTTAVILIDFPHQFDIRKPSYNCELGTDHDGVNLPYASGLTCKINNNLRRFEMSGQTTAYTLLTKIKVCYKIYEVENSKDTGESFNFIMRLFDVSAKSVKFKTVGILDYPSNLSYKRSGLRIFVEDIPNLPLGTMSNDITVSLEKSVPYDVVLTPQATGFRFEPESIDMKYYEGPSQKFRIIPLPGVEPGEHRITWVKQENNAGKPPRFSEMPDTYFTLKKEPDYRQLKLTISQNVYRTPIDAESMPIYVELSHPASKKMTVYYKTKQPFQPEFVNFGPTSLTFEPGEKRKKFTYTSSVGAVSGLIELSLQPEFQDLYYMPEKTINFEIQDRDTTPPEIVTYKVTEKAGTKLDLRVSADENTKIYYLASFRGTQMPPIEELMDPQKRALSKKKPETAEIMGNEHSKITKGTKTYVYHDTYIGLTDLIPDRDYDLFMLPVDTFGNIGKIKKVEFSTEPIPPPVKFSLKAKSGITDEQLFQALSLVTGVLPENFKITAKPDFSSIATGEKEVEDVLAKSALDYEIMILPNYTSDATSPYDLLKQIEKELETLLEELPQLVDDQSIGESGKEIMFDRQRILYKPRLVDITNFYSIFNASILYSGTIYGVILPKDEKPPSAIQIRYGLSSENFQIESYYKLALAVDIVEDKKYRIWPSINMKFTFLYHSTEYIAYFIADRNTYGSPILMKDEDIVSVKIRTERELFIVDDHVLIISHSSLSSYRMVLLFLVLLFFLRTPDNAD